MLNAEQIVAAHKAQLTAIRELTSKALAAVEEMADLNVRSIKSAMDEHTEQTQAILSTKDITDLTKLHHKALEPLAEKASAYSRHLFGIAAGLGNELSQMAEAQMADARQQFVAAAEAAMKNLPQSAAKSPAKGHKVA
jgi:phasin family protein